MTNNNSNKTSLAKRFRGFYPVVIDIETAGFKAETDALLEIGAVNITLDNNGLLIPGESLHHHVEPFAGAQLIKENLEFNKIDPFHPFRYAISEAEMLESLFAFVRKAQEKTNCKRCVLVAHNAWFDLSFLNAAINRSNVKKNPFHAFTCFDTATLSAVAYGQTVLAQAAKAAKITFDPEKGHSALYDAEKTAELFCAIVNQWP